MRSCLDALVTHWVKLSMPGLLVMLLEARARENMTREKAEKGKAL
jgi:hypothetical protein